MPDPLPVQLTRLASVCVALAPPVALAQEVGRHAEIVVTGRGLEDSAGTPAYGSEVLGREQLLEAASGRIEDALAGVAGVQQFRRSDSRSSNPTAQGLTLRALGGNASSRTLVLLDGVPMADPFFGSVPLSALAPERLAEARVIRGGGSGAFGAGAVAGTIALTSAGPDELGALAGSALIDSRGDTEAWAIAAPRLGNGFAVVAGRWDRGPGFFTAPPDQRGPASVRAGYESWSASLRGVARLAPDWELQARGLLYDDRRTLRFAGADTVSSGGDASLRLVGRGPWQVDLLGYLQVRDFSNVVISATSLRRVLDQRRTPATGFGGKLELRPPLPSGRALRLGTDLRITQGEAQEDTYSAATGLVTARRVAGGRNGDLGLFAEADWRLGAVLLTAGARADRWSFSDGFLRETSADGVATTRQRFARRTGWATSLRAGAVLEAGGGVSLRGSAYSGLRLPTLNELYRAFIVFPVRTEANALLQNERLRGIEAGIDWAPAPAIELALTAFDNRVRRAIANVTIAPNLRQRRNIGAVHSQGVEFAAGWRSGSVGLHGSLALTDARIEAEGVAAALNGRRPAQTARVSASATLTWALAEASRIALTLRHVGAQFEDDLGSDRLPPATTVDGHARLRVHDRLSLIVRGENLLDERIVTRNQGGSIDLGTPRTVWLGMSWGER